MIKFTIGVMALASLVASSAAAKELSCHVKVRGFDYIVPTQPLDADGNLWMQDLVVNGDPQFPEAQLPTLHVQASVRKGALVQLTIYSMNAAGKADGGANASAADNQKDLTGVYVDGLVPNAATGEADGASLVCFIRN